MEKSLQNYCVILAGGHGKRLWPSSRDQHPKQFIDFFGTGRTLLQTTFDRYVKYIHTDHIFVCTCKEFLPLVRQQLPELNERNILVEPVNRNTAASVAWANMRIKRTTPDANIIITPSDQLVMDEAAFQQHLETGLRYVTEHSVLLVMGVKPTRPEPGYGYIQLGDPNGLPGVYSVRSFTEKPEREFATLFMESGEFFWNTSIFLAGSRKLTRCFEKMFPSVLRELKFKFPNYTYEFELEFVKENYPRYPNLSIDHAILEHSSDVYVMACSFGWADLGSWHSIYETMGKGGDNVVIDSEVMIENSRNNVIKLPKGRLGVISGLEGFIVAEEDNVLLICKKSDSSALVRKYVNEVQMKYGDAYV